MLKSFAGGTLFGERWGTGPPQIVALHGWGRDRSDFREVLDGFDALAIDLPGFGASPEPAEVLGAGGYAELVSPILDEVDKRILILGHSFGGRVAVQLALSHPDRISALVLVGVPLVRRAGTRSRRPPTGYRVVRGLHRMGLLGDAKLERAKQRFGSPDYRRATGIMRDILVKVVNESYEPELRRIQCPVYLVWGSEDPEVPVEVAERSVRLLARGELSVIENVSHHVCLEAPEAVRSIVVEALS
jgi:pimeloyl-ACP methyl ester carboxylesterase